MIRLSANLSKKVPIIGQEFSSQQFGAALEIEISDADKADAIHARIRELYVMLNKAVDEQISSHGYGSVTGNAEGEASPPPVQPANRLPSQGHAQHQRPTARNNSNGTGNGQHNIGAGKPNTKRPATKATTAQVRAIFAIAKANNIDLAQVLPDFNVAAPEDLHVKDASRLIDELKASQSNGKH